MELDYEMSFLEISYKNRRSLGALKLKTMENETSELLPSEDGSVLEVQDESSDGTGSSEVRRSSRKRTPRLLNEINLTPADFISPSRILNIETDMKEIKKVYLNNTVKRKNVTLETIYEVPLDEKLMSSRKFKRTLTFQDNKSTNRLKSKKRLLKAKKITAKKRLTQKQISLEFLKQKLADVESDD